MQKVLENRLGGMAERLIAPVLKTGVGLVPIVGSNPTPSAARLRYSDCQSGGNLHTSPAPPAVPRRS